MNTYFIKVALRGTSPMIWCRLRVHGNTSLADLHYIIQIAMGWSNEYLHCFHIYGEDYGIAYEGGMSFSHNARQVFVDDFSFEVGDRFTYTYNFMQYWLCDIRVEAIEPTSKRTPWCFGSSGRQGDSRYYKTDEIIAMFDSVSDYITRTGRHNPRMNLGPESKSQPNLGWNGATRFQEVCPRID